MGAGFAKQGAVDASFALDILQLLSAQFSATNVSAAVIPAGLITGTAEVYLSSTGANGTTITTRTAAQLYADLQAATGLANINGWSYQLRITNTSGGITTLGAGTGVTLTGTMTIANNTFRDFVVTVNNPNSITITSVGTGTQS
jgi:UDP-N-acetylmuramyl tripeptide synthase